MAFGGSLGFLIVAPSSFYYTQNGIHAATFGLITAGVVGFLGHQIGHILDHPRGKRGKTPHWVKELFEAPIQGGPGSGLFGAAKKSKLTGDEIFLDDLGA